MSCTVSVKRRAALIQVVPGSLRRGLRVRRRRRDGRSARGATVVGFGPAWISIASAASAARSIFSVAF